MHNISTNVETVHRVVAMLVAVALVAWSVSYTSAQAANLVSISNTLSSSDRSVASNHTIRFTTPPTGPGVPATGTITITFPAGFSLGSVAFGDIDLLVNSAQQNLAATPSGATWGASISGQVLTIQSGTGTIGTSTPVEIRVGTNATHQVTGTNRVTNPSTAGSYEFVVTAGAADSGRTRVAILDDVLVTAVVETTFNFVVEGLATSTAINGSNTTGSTTPTAMPFGVLAHNTVYQLGQQLSVTTNAANGFVVTVQKDSEFQSTSGGVIDTFINGSNNNVPAAWVAPAANIASSTTWGHWGMTSNDSNLNANEFNVGAGGNRYIAVLNTPRTIFSHTGPADGTTQDAGRARVGYQVEISPFQEAGFDYQTNVMYIATPTF